MMLRPIWTPLEDSGENQKSKPAMPQEKQRRAFGSPMVDITNRPAGVSPRPSPKQKSAGSLRRRTSSLSGAGVESSGIMQNEQEVIPEIQPLPQIVDSESSISKTVEENITGGREITTIEVQPQLSPANEAIVCSITSESDPTVSRSTALRILKDRAQMRAQAKVDVDEKTPCATQIRDVLDVLLLACAIILVIAMVVVFYQLTVHGHAQRLLFAVRNICLMAHSVWCTHRHP